MGFLRDLFEGAKWAGGEAKRQMPKAASRYADIFLGTQNVGDPREAYYTNEQKKAVANPYIPPQNRMREIPKFRPVSSFNPRLTEFNRGIQNFQREDPEVDYGLPYVPNPYKRY